MAFSNLPDQHLHELQLRSEEILKGHFLHAFRDTVQLPDGETAVREYVIHPGAVMIIPLLDDPLQGLKLVLERQFRYPVGQVMIEFPAGKLDSGESPLACAQREMQEETGYTVILVKLLGVFSSARYEYVHYPWKDNEFCHLLFHGTIKGGHRRLSDETIDIAFFAPDALPPLSDGHQPRLEHAFRALADSTLDEVVPLC